MPVDPGPTVVSTGSGRVMPGAGEPETLPGDAGCVLLPLARTAIATQLGLGRQEHAGPQWLQRPGACFITLTRDARLRGCVGTLRAHRALADDVAANAVAAAFRDPRFPPITIEEFATVALEISVLSALEPMRFDDEPHALGQLRRGIDGLVFEYGHHTSTFLPQVWEDFKEPTEFIAHLKYKAGLPPDFWDSAVKLSRYTVHKWRESDL